MCLKLTFMNNCYCCTLIVKKMISCILSRKSLIGFSLKQSLKSFINAEKCNTIKPRLVLDFKQTASVMCDHDDKLWGHCILLSRNDLLKDIPINVLVSLLSAVNKCHINLLSISEIRDQRPSDQLQIIFPINKVMHRDRRD